MANPSDGNKHKRSGPPKRSSSGKPAGRKGSKPQQSFKRDAPKKRPPKPIPSPPKAEGSEAEVPKAPRTRRAPRPSKSGTGQASGSGPERLHKRIAASGLCSRRAAEELIREGRVEVNGATITEMGYKVGPDDEVRVDERPIAVAKTYTLVMNKPAGYLTTLSDPQNRPTVKKLLPPLEAQVKPVGRLDMETEGLLLFTNDGLLAQRLSHPRFGVEKEYQAVVQGAPTEEALDRLRKGIWIVEGGKTAPAHVVRVHEDRRGNSTVLRITIHEGRKRQIRLMCEAIGHPVTALRRIRIGPLVLKNLASGECRMLGKVEVDKLKKLVGLETK